MSDSPQESVTQVCDRCGRSLTPADRVPAGDKVFCGSCYETLRQEVHQALEQMSTDIPYPMAALGAILGGLAGVALWWGFTVVTRISFGLIAVAIGFLVGWGAVKFAGGKRSAGLQVLCVAVVIASFVLATYLVNMTFINRALAQQGEAMRIGFPPATLDLFVRVISTNFGIMELVFLGIAVFQAWSMSKPLTLAEPVRSSA